ncbi:MAG: hypothetical protein AMXMBFR6_03430 [Betaproteobacteria bacterium]
MAWPQHVGWRLREWQHGIIEVVIADVGGRPIPVVRDRASLREHLVRESARPDSASRSAGIDTTYVFVATLAQPDVAATNLMTLDWAHAGDLLAGSRPGV